MVLCIGGGESISVFVSRRPGASSHGYERDLLAAEERGELVESATMGTADYIIFIHFAILALDLQ